MNGFDYFASESIIFWNKINTLLDYYSSITQKEKMISYIDGVCWPNRKGIISCCKLVPIRWTSKLKALTWKLEKKLCVKIKYIKIKGRYQDENWGSYDKNKVRPYFF